jgi:hypothetical protein
MCSIFLFLFFLRAKKKIPAILQAVVQHGLKCFSLELTKQIVAEKQSNKILFK